jgi:hypothetical protein
VGYVSGLAMFTFGIFQMFRTYRIDYIRQLHKEMPPHSTEKTRNNFAGVVSFLGGVSNNALCGFWFTYFLVAVITFFLTWSVTQ